MTIADIKQTELNVGERDVLEADRERWKRLGAGAHLDDWLAFAPGLMIMRRLAMRIAYTNQPAGKAYTTALNQLYADGGYNVNDKSAMAAMTAVLWLNDDPERLAILRQIREAMTPGERSRLNSPISARQRVLKVLTARQCGTEAQQKDSPLAIERRKVIEKDREIADLQAKLAKHNDGSLFDLRKDAVPDIVTAILANTSPGKAAAIGNALVDGAKRKSQRPDG